MSQTNPSPTARRLPKILGLMAIGGLALGAVIAGPVGANADWGPECTPTGLSKPNCVCVTSNPQAAAETGCCLRPDVP